VGGTSPVQTATLTFTAGGTVASINALTQGAPNVDFKYASGGTCTAGKGYSNGQTCTVKYTFSPTSPGARYGAVTLYNHASPANAIATTYLQATGDGPQLAFAPGTVQEVNVAGLGELSAGGIAVDGSGNVFVTDNPYDATVYEIPVAGGYTTLNPLAHSTHRLGPVVIDGAGNLFFGDIYSPYDITELTAASGYTKLVTLLENTGYNNYPDRLAVDGGGNVFVTYPADRVVKEIVAAGGYATVVTISTGSIYAQSIAVDGNGNIFVADSTDSSSIYELVAAGGYTTILPIGQSLYYPYNLALDGSGNIFVLTSDFKLHELLADGGYAKSITLESGGQFNYFALDFAGNVFAVRSGAHFLHKLNVADPPSHNFATTAAGSTSSDSPRTVTAINNGNQTLHFSDLSYPVDFQERAGVPTDCTSSTDLAAGGTCTLTMRFAPLRTSATGLSTPLSEEVSLTDDNLNVIAATQSVAVSGTETFTPPALTSPAPSSTLAGSSVTFSWTPGSAKFFKFWLGTTIGSNNIYGIGQTEKTSVTVSNLPTNGKTVYARLYYLVGSVWQYTDYTYTAQ
jgi:hypothetical protein